MHRINFCANFADIVEAIGLVRTPLHPVYFGFMPSAIEPQTLMLIMLTMKEISAFLELPEKLPNIS